MTRLGIAIGGLAYPIDEFIPKGIKCFRSAQWRMAQYEITAHDGPVTIIGFSWGAEMALKLATYPNVDRVFAHSPGGMKFADAYSVDFAAVHILATEGDRLCYESSKTAYAYFLNKIKRIYFRSLPFQEFKPKNLVERLMVRNKHQFSNAIPFLEGKGWGME